MAIFDRSTFPWWIFTILTEERLLNARGLKQNISQFRGSWWVDRDAIYIGHKQQYFIGLLLVPIQ